MDQGQSTGGAGVLHPVPQDPEPKRHSCYLCSRSYERQDHLHRHLKSHENDRAYRCADCAKGFNRADLLNRHRAAHTKVASGEAFRRRTGRACRGCIKAKTRCDDDRPCKRCTTRAMDCEDSLDEETGVSRRLTGSQHRSSVASSESRAPEEPQYESIAGVPVLAPGAARSGLSETLLEGTTLANLGSTDDFREDTSLDFGCGFPDFFEQIMMPNVPNLGSHEPVPMPPDVSNFNQDIDFGTGDFDFSFLASGLTRPSTAQNFYGASSTGLAETLPTPGSDSGLRSDPFNKSPWSWNHWIPERGVNTFSGQELNIHEERLSSDDQLTSPNERRIFHCSLPYEARDRMMRMVIQTAISSLPVPSFPSLQMLEDLIDVALLQDMYSIGCQFHPPTFDPHTTRVELLLGIVAAGAKYIALPPVWRMGLVIQEIVRVAAGQMFEKDNSTTRELQAVQAHRLYLDVGVWSGFRRKTEISCAFLQPVATLLAWSNTLAKFRYVDIVPSMEDDGNMLVQKWKAWVEQEGWKRLVMQVFLHDSSVMLVYMRNPLISAAEMLLPVPAARELYLAPSAQAWRNAYLSKKIPRQADFPSAIDVFGDPSTLEGLEGIVDKQYSLLVACHALAQDVWSYRQQAHVLEHLGKRRRRDRITAHSNRQRDLYDDLNNMLTYCEIEGEACAEIAFTLHFLMMSLHTSLADIQLVSGKAGEDEARRVYPRIRTWIDEAESRIGVWHAGQVLRVARSFEKTKLRDFYAVAVYHAALLLWVYGMVASNAARPGHEVTPDMLRPGTSDKLSRVSGTITSGRVHVDADDEKAARAFTQLGYGLPGLTKSGTTAPHESLQSDGASSNFCALYNSRGVMTLAADVLRSNFPKSRNGLPPLVDNLATLMDDLGKLSS